MCRALVHSVQMPRVPPVLSTARLVLRPLTTADGLGLEPLLNDPVVREMFHWSADTPTDGTQWAAAQLAMQDQDAVAIRSYTWAVTLLGADTLIGFAQLGSITFQSGAEPALALSPSSRGHGYGLEIMNELVRWGFEDMVPDWARTSDNPDNGNRLGKMTALAMPHNVASIAMLSRTLLDDQGIVTANQPGGTAQARAFGLTRQQYLRKQAADD